MGFAHDLQSPHFFHRRGAEGSLSFAEGFWKKTFVPLGFSLRISARSPRLGGETSVVIDPQLIDFTRELAIGDIDNDFLAPLCPERFKCRLLNRSR